MDIKNLILTPITSREVCVWANLSGWLAWHTFINIGENVLKIHDREVSM
jgi:hypothetical protein